MIRSVNRDITAAANGETLETFVSGVEGVERRVTEIRFQQVADLDLRGYIDQDRIVDVGGECEENDTNPVPVDCPVPVGKIFAAGFQNNTGAPQTMKITVFFEETK